MTQGALSDLRVIEYGHHVSGPFCGKLFADLGAEVIKVEEPAGDEARARGPFPGDVPHPEKSGLFLYLNTNKLGSTLNVRHPRGKQIFLDLVKGADILIENNPPQVMEELGLTYERLRQVNPGLIMTSITWFGQTGPYRDYKGSDLVCFQMGCVGYETPGGYVTDPETENPLRGGGHQTHLSAGWHAASATMTALFHRQVTGEGQHVDVSEQETMANTVRPNVSLYSYEHRIQSRLKAGFPRLSPTKDGYVTMGVTGQTHWPRFKEAMGNPEWAESEIFATQVARTVNGDVLATMMAPWLLERTKEEVFQLAQEKGFICFPLNNVDDLFVDEHYRAREFFVETEHPVAGRLPYPRAPYIFSATPWRAGRAPCLGEHNEEIYCGRLGYSRQDLVRLRQLGVI